MQERTIHHNTFVLERTYPVPPERVFAAFADPEKRRRWAGGDEGPELGEYRPDFRPGGVETRRFRIHEGPIKGTEMISVTTFQDIVPNQRIVYAYTMEFIDRVISVSLASFELIATAQGTKLVFTEQGAYFPGADPLEMRQAGWNFLLDSLSREASAA